MSAQILGEQLKMATTVQERNVDVQTVIMTQQATGVSQEGMVAVQTEQIGNTGGSAKNPPLLLLTLPRAHQSLMGAQTQSWPATRTTVRCGYLMPEAKQHLILDVSSQLLVGISSNAPTLSLRLVEA